MSSLIIIAVYILIFFIVVFLCIVPQSKRKKQLRRYESITLGMSEAEMISIMGKGYNKSLLKNNRTKYEWRINASSHGSSYKGISTRSYSGVSKVDIYCKNGIVEEVKPYNVR